MNNKSIKTTYDSAPVIACAHTGLAPGIPVAPMDLLISDKRLCPHPDETGIW